MGFLKLLFIKTCCILMISLMAFLGGGLLARLRPYPLSKAIIRGISFFYSYNYRIGY